MAIERRAFLRGAAVGTLALLPLPALAQDAVATLVADPTDPVANSEPGRWAAGELHSAMSARGLDVQQATSVTSAPSGLVIVLASMSAPATAALAAGRPSSITAVTPGTPLSPSRGRSCQSGSAIGPTSVDQFEGWYEPSRDTHKV